jgi:tol-pal system protein YbgF
LRKFICFLLFLTMLSIAGCASTGDMRALRAELNMKMDEKIAALDADVNALKKDAAAIESMRNGQANTTADMSELKESIQQLRGQVEALKKDYSANAKKDDQRFDNILLKINFIENFLDIGGKHNSGDASDRNGKSTAGASSKDPAKKLDKEKAYSDAYQTFKEGNYDKARTEFQNYLLAFPDSEYSDNAQFWVGECYFFEKKYESAILEYEKVKKKYPNGNKVPYALLKQGISFLNLGDKTSAKLLLQEVIKSYPNTSQARIARSSLQEIK